MAIYGQSWRGGGNMSFRNPMAKAAMNNNPMGNQQTLKPQDISAYKQAAQPWALQQSTAYQPGPAMSPVSAIKAPRPSMSPGFGDQIPDYSSAPSPAIPTANPQTPSPQRMSLNPASMQNQGIIQNPAMASQAFSLERARQYQANRQATPAAPQYINPEFRAGQANMQRLNRSMAQTLNRPLQRRADAIAGVQPGPMINPNAARNVLMGQNPDADLSMRPMTIPGMKFDSQQNAMVRSSPYEARGIQPGSLRQDPIMAFEKFDNPDDFRVATGGTPMIPFGSKGGQVSGGNPMSQAGISSVANARIARAARLNGVTSSGIDQWRKTSPIAQTIRGNADTRIANLPQNAASQVQPVTAQAPATAPQDPAAVLQVQPNQNTGVKNWSDIGTPQTNSVSPIQRIGTNEIAVPQGVPVEGRDYPAKFMKNPGFTPQIQQNWGPLPPRPPITYQQPTFRNLFRQATGIFQ